MASGPSSSPNRPKNFTPANAPTSVIRTSDVPSTGRIDANAAAWPARSAFATVRAGGIGEHCENWIKTGDDRGDGLLRVVADLVQEDRTRVSGKERCLVDESRSDALPHCRVEYRDDGPVQPRHLREERV